MKRILLSCLLLCSLTMLYAQRRIGLTASYDYAFNSADKLMQSSIGRKFTIGISFGDVNKNFVGFVSAGFKGFKTNLYSPDFQPGFLKTVSDNYQTITNSTHDSLVGISLFRLSNNEQGFYLHGTYSLHLQAGLIWNSCLLRPSLFCYVGTEQFLLRTPLFFNNQNYQETISMNADFWEIKAGIGLPWLRDKPWAVNLNAGFKHIDYQEIRFDGTPLSAYTKGDIAKDYCKNNKMTVSVSVVWWSNWNPGKEASSPREL